MHLSRVGSTLTSNMKARVAATKRVLAEAGVRGAAALPVLSHSDATGTRPDVMVASAAHVHPAVLRYLAAHHGLLHGMPNVVAFNAHPSGPDRVHVIHSGLDQAAVFDTMRRAGMPRFSVHENVVYLFDPGASYDVSHLLGPLNASQYHAVNGHGRVVGAREGADAPDQRAAYRDAVRAAEALATGGGSGPGDGPAAQGADPAALKLAREAFPHGLLWTSEPEDTAGFVGKYLSARGTKRTTAPLAAMADRFAEQHGDHPVGKWLPWIVSHPDVKVTKGPTTGYPGHWSEIGVASHELVDGRPAITATIRDGRKRRQVRLHVPVTTPETAAALRELHADLGGHEHTPYAHADEGRRLEERLAALKLSRVRDVEWRTDRVWAEDTPPQVLAQFIEDHPEHAHDPETYEHLRRHMDTGGRHGIFWSQHPETGRIAAWAAPASWAQAKHLRQSVHPAAIPEPAAWYSGPGGSHRAIGDSHQRNIAGILHVEEHDSHEDAKAAALAAAWPPHRPLRLARAAKAPDATLAYGGEWKLPAASLDALHAHATGVTPLSDAEVVAHLTNHPHPVAGRIASLPTTRVRVETRRPGYTPESHHAAEALSLLRGGGHVSDEQVRQGFYGNLPETKAAEPGELMHSGEGSDFLLHHAPSDTWLSVNLDHDLGPGGVTAEHAAQYRRAKQALVRPILKRFLRHGG